MKIEIEKQIQNLKYTEDAFMLGMSTCATECDLMNCVKLFYHKAEENRQDGDFDAAMQSALYSQFAREALIAKTGDYWSYDGLRFIKSETPETTKNYINKIRRENQT